jgi:hypothetical protein
MPPMTADKKPAWETGLRPAGQVALIPA